jgi:hypothetical protein
MQASYLDAAYGYAYFDAARGDLNIDVNDPRKKLEVLQSTLLAEQAKASVNRQKRYP